VSGSLGPGIVERTLGPHLAGTTHPDLKCMMAGILWSYFLYQLGFDCEQFSWGEFNICIRLCWDLPIDRSHMRSQTQDAQNIIVKDCDRICIYSFLYSPCNLTITSCRSCRVFIYTFQTTNNNDRIFLVRNQTWIDQIYAHTDHWLCRLVLFGTKPNLKSMLPELEFYELHLRVDHPKARPQRLFVSIDS
jgi:hypothetical protein